MSDTEKPDAINGIPSSYHRYLLGGTTYHEGSLIIDQLDLISDYHYDIIDGQNILEYKYELEVDGINVLEKIR